MRIRNPFDSLPDIYRAASILVLFLLFANFISGCAKNVGPDNVPAIAAILKDAASDAVFLGLKAIDQEAPEQTAPTIIDIGVVIGALQDYEDGSIGVLDAKNSIVTLFDRLRERLMILPDSVYVDAGVVALKAGANLLAIYISDYKAPEEVSDYIGAIRVGFEDGVRRFNGFKNPPLSPVLSTNYTWTVMP